MTRIDARRVVDITAALAMLLAGVLLIVVVFPDQIPEGLEGDLSSGHYPRTIMIVWISAAGAWLAGSLWLLKRSDGTAEGSLFSRRSVLIGVTIAVGFALFVAVGFLVAAFVLIVSLAYICGERGLAPWVLAATIPPSVYFFLDLLLDVRLPTVLSP